MPPDAGRPILVGSRDLTEVQARLRDGYRTYENRCHLKTRLDLLDADIMSLRGFERILTATEKVNLAQRYEGGCEYPEVIITNYDPKERENASFQMNLFDAGFGLEKEE